MELTRVRLGIQTMLLDHYVLHHHADEKLARQAAAPVHLSIAFVIRILVETLTVRSDYSFQDEACGREALVGLDDDLVVGQGAVAEHIDESMLAVAAEG